MKHLAAMLAVLTLQLGSSIPARAVDPRFPDWPCVQAKVPEVSVVAVWSGPSIEGVGNTWQNDPNIKDLVTRLAARRVTLDEAEKSITEFLSGSPADKQEKGKLLFAGLFDTLNSERSEIMNGIERFTRKQRDFAEKIRADTLQLRQLQDAPNRDQQKTDDLANQVEWETRIFEERRKTTTYVCEVPVLMERRLFALARTIQQSME